MSFACFPDGGPCGLVSCSGEPKLALWGSWSLSVMLPGRRRGCGATGATGRDACSGELPLGPFAMPLGCALLKTDTAEAWRDARE